MDSLASKNSTNLSSQVKKAIGYRILFCFLLAMLVVFIISINDTGTSLRQLQENLAAQSRGLENFAISQVLLNNEQAIQPKFDSISQSSNTEKFSWKSSAKGLGNTLKKPKLSWHLPFSWVYTYPVKGTDGTLFGAITVTGSLLHSDQLFSSLLEKISLLLLFFLIIFFVLHPLSKKIPQNLFISPINNLLLLLRKDHQNTESKDYFAMPEEFIEIRKKINELLKEAEEHSREVALGQLVTQVAHDIRSPLLTLSIEAESLTAIPEKNRINIRNAVQRVNDIANNLLTKYKQEKSKQGDLIPPSPELASMILESIASEKRTQIAGTDITLTLTIEKKSYDSFVNVVSSELKRVLSNIINNSIEAIAEKGMIELKLSKMPGKICIGIKDNGCGIPKDKLLLVLGAGVSIGKKEGSGLGLPYAINKISSWHGDYSLTSAPGEGTLFEITLPETRPAAWFAQEISIVPDGKIVVLDDDDHIHKIWETRFNKEFLSQNKVAFFDFRTPSELMEFCNTHEIKKTVFLLDYELIGHTETGLDLAEMLGIGEASTLVTNRYEDPDIRDRAYELGMKIVPKLFAGLTPFRVLTEVEIIFIDDDDMITSVWKERATLSGKKLTTFNDPRDFSRVCHLYEKNTPIYIDSLLGGNLKGEDFAKTFYENGYRNIFLTTALPKEMFKHVYWVQDVIDKNPPF